MTIFQTGIRGLGGLLLLAAGAALVLLAGALLLAFGVLILVALGGLYLTSPEESRALLKAVPRKISEWMREMRAMVEYAGSVLLTALGKRPPQAAETAEAAEAAKNAQASPEASSTESTKSEDSAPREALSEAPETRSRESAPR